MVTDMNSMLFLSEGGEMGARMRAHDWAGTPLGPASDWPPALKAVVSAVINSPMLGTVLWGPELRMLYNDGYVPSLADRHPAALGQPVAAVWGASWSTVASPFLELLKTGCGFSNARVELPMVRNGIAEVTWWNFSASPIRDEDGEIVGILNQGAEITEQVFAEKRLQEERTQAEEALRQSNRDLEKRVARRTAERDQMWNTSPDLMLIIGFDGRFIRVNPAWTTTLGYSSEELIGHHVNEFVVAPDHDSTVAAYELAAHGGLPRIENRYRHKNGSLRHISWVAAPSTDVTYATGRDVTAERQRQAELETAKEQFRQAQKMEAIGQLTGGIAHDFNNLLTIISTSLQLLQKPGLADDRRQRFLGSISSAVVRASKLTGQLLAFARRQSLQPVVFDATGNVLAIQEMLQTLAGSRIEIVLEHDAEACVVDVDPAQFDATIVNLVANARDAMDGIGTIRISTDRVFDIPAHRAHSSVTGEFVAISVSDVGVGIAPELLDRVFEPFYTTKPVGQGTGLGLSQVFGFAKQSRGDVRVDSALGRGTTVTVYLPVSGRPLKPQDLPVPESAIATSAFGRLLYVEDNADVAAATMAILEDVGYVVVGVDNGNAALEHLANDKAGFAAVMSDVMMAPMDGVTLARRIKADHPTLPILLCSGYSSFLASTQEHGFKVLPKPFTVEQLSVALRSLFVVPPVDGKPQIEPVCAQTRAPENEAARVADLRALNVLDTPDEVDYDEVVLIAAALFDAPTALITLVDTDRQWFKARTGYVGRETPRIESVCSYAIRHPDEVMVVGDASKDPRFADNPVIREMNNIQFYVGAPLVTSTGHAIGTVCVFDTVAREPDPRQLIALKVLAKQVVERLERRRLSVPEASTV